MSAQKEIIDCCICMDPINSAINNCVTPCGHTFCFQCLAQALSQNKTCPCCRAVLMEQPENEDDDDEWTIISDEEDEQDDDVFGDEAMTSFRMLFQRVYGEEVEPDVDQEEDDVSIEQDEEAEPLAEVEDITAKLQSRGITMLDLVAMLTDRKSTKVAKHTDRFIDALDDILDNAIMDCDNEAKEAVLRAQSTQVQSAESIKEIA